MNKYRIKFSKTGRIRFVGHLDLLKIFQRTVKRANLPIAYSQGFNPHQQMSFAIPLPLGMESISEYLDIKLEENLTRKEVFERLNTEMPIGLEIINVLKLKEDEKNAPSIVCGGEYEVTLDREINIDEFNKKISELLNSEEINIEKKTKKRGKEVLKTINIKDEIYE
ncbi:MAG: TIGR03936 family radical SAM-associated protein, partial [Eubacteriales bacterium]|nr:TIGR03936 family radical SAM-associated protein [Eubacteriales bacterium]